MTWLWIALGFLFIILGLMGFLIPALPGPPVAYAGLWLQQIREPDAYSATFLLTWGAIVMVVLVLDYYIPVWGTKKLGGSKYGMWGCTIGFLAAFWLGPWGIIIGPFAGAFLGELLANQTQKKALKAAFGAFLGFLGGSLFKIIVCLLMGYYLVISI